MSKQHHLQLIGQPKLSDPDGAALHFRTKKQLALLVYLALEARNQPTSRELLADLFWPDAGQRNALHSLSQGLTEIRKRIGTDSLNANRTHVQLLAQLSDDLGPEDSGMSTGQIATPLEGLEDCAGRRFADWVERTRDCIRASIRARLSEELSEARTDGKVLAVHERAELLYKVDPHSDAAVQALAEERFSSGDWAGGIRLVRKHISDSERDFGRSPSAEVLATLRRFERGLLRDPVNGGLASGDTPSIAIRPQVFVGRESEMARLQALLYEVEAGSFRTCALKGPDGIGKSAILRRFSISAATRSVPSYRVDCQEIGQNIPFAAVSDLLDQLARDPALSGTDPVWLAEASRVAPRIRVAYPGIPEPPSTAPETVRLRLAEAIKEMLDVVADGCPVLVAFDDMHYMDPASRDVLHVLARRLANTATLLLAAVRSTEPDVALGGVDGLKGIEWEECLGIGPLEDPVLEELVIALSDRDQPVDKPTAAHIVQMAQGNPYLAEILVADWKHSGSNFVVFQNDREIFARNGWHPSDTMRRTLERHINSLTKHALRMAQLVSVSGRGLPIEDLPGLLGINIPLVNRTALELIEHSFARLEGGTLRLRSPLHQAYVYWVATSNETRRLYHSTLTEFFKATRDEKDFQHALITAHHAVRAGKLCEASQFVSHGAELAIASGAAREAETAILTVMNQWPQDASIDITILLAKAQSAQGHFERALCTIKGIVISECSGIQRAAVAHLHAEALHRGRLAPDDDTILVAARDAMDRAIEISDDRLALKAQQIAAEIAHESGRWDVLELIEEECVRVEHEVQDTEVRGLANLTLGYCRLVSGEPTIAAQFFSHSARLLSHIGLDMKLHRALNGLGMSVAGAARFAEALDAFRKAADAALRSGDYVAYANALLNLGSLTNELGHFSQAVRYFRRAIDAEAEVSTSRVSTALHCNAANLSIVLGNLDEAGTFLQTASAAADRSGLWQHSVSVSLTRADLHLAKDQPDRAWRLVEEALDETGDQHRLLPDLGQYWRLRRHYYSATGEGDIPTKGSPAKISTAHLLELQAFEELHDGGGGDSPAVAELVDLGLFGVLARLAAVGIWFRPLEHERSGTSGAQIVSECFPEARRKDVPKAVIG